MNTRSGIRFVLGLLGLTAAIMQCLGAAPQRITSKEVSEHPFTMNVADRKIDPKLKDVFDEFRVIVTTTLQTRIRITGKQKAESGSLEGRPVLHLGKAALMPLSDQTGTLKVGESSVFDVRRYFIILEVQKDKLMPKSIDLKKGVAYKWAIEQKDGQVMFDVKDGENQIGMLQAPVDQVKAFGIAAVGRWVGTEVDITMSLEQ